MILEEDTFKKFGYYPRNLKSQSDKRILAACDECGKVRETSKNGYSALCLQCARKKSSRLLTEKDKKENNKMIGILEQETYDRFGYYPSDLKPSSRKKVVLKCIKCEKIREVCKKDYRDLCISCTNRGQHRSEEIKQKMRDNHVDFRGSKNPMHAKHHSDETKSKISKTRRENRIASGEANPNWKGGLSFEPYCILFNNEFKERVREYWNRTCVLCGKNEEENGKRLEVHHVTYNKDACCDDSMPLFVVLCRSCHTKTNSKRKDWQEEFERIIYSRSADGKCFYSKEEMNEMKEEDSDD